MSAAPDVANGASHRKLWSDHILIVAGVFVLLVVVLLALFFRRRPAPEQPLYHVMISTPRLDVSNGSRIALSRDGRRIAFVTVDASGARHLAVRSLESDVVQTITSATDARNDPFWSPDGHFIGYFTTDSLKTVDLASGQVRTLARTASATRGGSWGANDQIVFTMLGPAAPFATIHSVPAFGGEAKQVTFPHRDEVHMYPYFLPDGRRFLFSVFTGVTGHVELRLGSLDNRETRSLGVIAGNAVVATPSVLLFRRAETLFAQRVNPNSLSFVGDAVPIVDHIRYYAINGFGAFSASENGVLVFRRGGNTQTHLRWFDRAGKPLRDVGQPGSYWSFDLSRDETRLAATKDDPVLGQGQLWTGDADRAALTRLTSSSDWEPDSAWSPDGQHLAYIRQRGAQFALMLRDENGIENERIRLDRPQWLRSPAWSPDGRFLAVAAGFFNNSKSRVMLMDSYGASPATDLIGTKGMNAMPQFSPDGRWIAYVSSEESDRPKVYIRPFPDVNRGKWLISADGGVQPRWRADGREMFYLDPTNQVIAVPIKAARHVFQVGKPVQLFQANVPWNPVVRYEYAVSQDGQRIVACVLAEEDDRSIEMLIHWNSILR